MQEIIRTNFDHYIDDEENGKNVEVPFIYRIPKGTPIPKLLTLFHEYMAHFSLQPSVSMNLEDLNRSLDEFYAQYAEVKTAEQWLDENEFRSAVADDACAVWMAK
ncbi:hypothetical protein MMC12_003043 [Toensbergia leucococca]|nr:hypothetical protein [Toensbergia leucococca]